MGKSDVPRYFEIYLDERFKNVEIKIENIQVQLNELLREIRGSNGRIGILQRVEKNEEGLAEIKTKIAMFIAVGGVFLSLVMEVVKSYIKSFFN